MLQNSYQKSAFNYKIVTYSDKKWDMLYQARDSIFVRYHQRNYQDSQNSHDSFSGSEDYNLDKSTLLGQILISHKLLTVEQLNSVLKQQQIVNKKLGELLLESDLITPKALDIALKEQYWRRNGYWVIG